MEVICHDDNDVIYSGPGYIEIQNSMDIDYTIYAKPKDEDKAFRLYNRAKKNPYDTLKQFLIRATDYEGIKWDLGWASVNLKGDPKVGWPLAGRVNSLTTDAEGVWVSNKSNVELVFHPKISIPMDELLITISKIGTEEIQRASEYGKQSLNIFDSEISFFYPPSTKSLWVTATTSKMLPHPHLENWIGEALTILLGQIVYPRLVARNFGNGKAAVWLRPSPKRSDGIGFASLHGEDPFLKKEVFWPLYSKILEVISNGRDENGHPYFDPPHPLTRFYQEIIHSTHGTVWVLCMTLSSVAEGIVRLLLPEQKKPKVTTYLKELVSSGILRPEPEKAWTKVRNAVAHGKLVSPWPTEEDDTQIKDLMELVRVLTIEYIERELGSMTH